MPPPEEDEKRIWIAVVTLVICALGVLLNAVVILVVAISPSIRSSTDLYIVNLSVSGILLAAIALPLRFMSVFYDQLDFYGDDVVCKLLQFVPLFTIMSAITTMTVISFDRYIVITRFKKMTVRSTLITIAVIWIVSLATSAPQIYEYSAKPVPNIDDNGTHLSCGSHDVPENFETIYACSILAVSYVIPLIVMTVNYFRLVAYLYMLSKQRGEVMPGQGGYKLFRKKVEVLRMVIVITTVFATLWLTYFVLFTIEEITNTDSTSHAYSAAHTAKHVMMALSTVSNPLLYAAYNKRFRWRLLNACRSGRGKSDEKASVEVHVGTKDPVSRNVSTSNRPTINRSTNCYCEEDVHIDCGSSPTPLPVGKVTTKGTSTIDTHCQDDDNGDVINKGNITSHTNCDGKDNVYADSLSADVNGKGHREANVKSDTDSHCDTSVCIDTTTQ